MTRTVHRPDAHLRELLEDARVDRLYHFTMPQNLDGILSLGLLSPRACAARGLQPVRPTLGHRAGPEDAISVTLSWPHPRVAGSTLLAARGAGWEGLVLVELDASLLWRHPCLFTIDDALAPFVNEPEPLQGVPLAQLLSTPSDRAFPVHAPYAGRTDAVVLLRTDRVPPSAIRRLVVACEEDRRLVEQHTTAPRPPVALEPALFCRHPLPGVRGPSEIAWGPGGDQLTDAHELLEAGDFAQTGPPAVLQRFEFGV